MDKQVWQTPLVTDFKTTDVEGIGRLRSKDGFMYRWVKNSTGVAMVAGRAYYHGSAHTLGFQAEVFTLGQTGKGTAIVFLAGLAMSAVPIGGYGWVLVDGIHDTAGVEGTADVAVGDQLKGVSGQTYLVTDAVAGQSGSNTAGGLLNLPKVTALAAQTANSVAATPVQIKLL